MFYTQRAGPSRVAAETPSEKVRKEWRAFVTTWYSPERTKLEDALQNELNVKYKNKKGIAQKTARETERQQRLTGIKRTLAEPARDQWEQRLQRARLREEEWDMTSAEKAEVLDVFYGLFGDPEDDIDSASDGELDTDEEDDLAHIEEPTMKTPPALPSPITPLNGAYEFVNPTSLQTKHNPGLPHPRLDPLSDLAPPNPFSTASRSQNTSGSGFLGGAFTSWASEAGLTKHTPEIPQSQLLSPERVSRQSSANSALALYRSSSADTRKTSPHSSPPGDSSSKLATPGKRYIGPVLFDTEGDAQPAPDADVQRLKSEIDKDTRRAHDAEFRRFKLDVRIRLIHEFHKEAAELEVVLVERLESQNLPRERINMAVQEHEEQMIELRQKLDAKRKQMCDEERQRWLKALSRPTIEGPPIPKQIEHPSATKLKMERPRAVTIEAASDDEDDWSIEAARRKAQKMDDTRLDVGAASSMEILLGRSVSAGPSAGSTMDLPSALKKSHSSQPQVTPVQAPTPPKSAWGVKKSVSANPTPTPFKPAPPAREEAPAASAASSSKPKWTKTLWSGSNEDVSIPSLLPGNSFAHPSTPIAPATQAPISAPSQQAGAATKGKPVKAGWGLMREDDSKPSHTATPKPAVPLNGPVAGKPVKAGWGLMHEDEPIPASAKGKGKEKAPVPPMFSGMDSEVDLAELIKNASVADDSSGTEADTPPATSVPQQFFTSTSAASAPATKPPTTPGWGLSRMANKWGLWGEDQPEVPALKETAPSPAPEPESVREPEPEPEPEQAPPPPPVTAKGKKSKKGQAAKATPAKTPETAPPAPAKQTPSTPAPEPTSAKGKGKNKASKKSKKANAVELDDAAGEETEREVLRSSALPASSQPFVPSQMPGSLFDGNDDTIINAEESAALARASADEAYWRNILNGGTKQASPTSFAPAFAPPLARDPSPPRVSALDTEMAEDEPEPSYQHAFWRPSSSRDSMYSVTSEDDGALRDQIESEMFKHMVMHGDDAPAHIGARPSFTGLMGPSSSSPFAPTAPNGFGPGFGLGFAGQPGMSPMGGDFATVPSSAFGGMGNKKGPPAPAKGPAPTEGWPRMAQSSGSARLF